MHLKIIFNATLTILFLKKERVVICMFLLVKPHEYQNQHLKSEMTISSHKHLCLLSNKKNKWCFFT